MTEPDEDEGFADGFSLRRGDYWGSTTSSAYAFPQENGRTYHAYGAGKYYVPNDSKEQERMDLVDLSIDLMFEGSLFFAPVKNPQVVVDIGTGTGIWAIKVGDLLPSASVIGIDLSPIQPTWSPPNVEFRVDDLENDWIYGTPLDLVHSRVCSGSAIRDWPSYLSKAYDALKPGGFVEAQEFDLDPQSDDDSFPPNSQILKWHSLIYSSFMQGGCDMRLSAAKLREHFEAAGFVNITVIEYNWPMSPWPKDRRLRESGAAVMLSMLEDIEGLSVSAFTRFLGYEMEELKEFLGKVKREWARPDVHGYWPLFVVYGQKPFDVKGE